MVGQGSPPPSHLRALRQVTQRYSRLPRVLPQPPGRAERGKCPGGPLPPQRNRDLQEVGRSRVGSRKQRPEGRRAARWQPERWLQLPSHPLITEPRFSCPWKEAPGHSCRPQRRETPTHSSRRGLLGGGRPGQAAGGALSPERRELALGQPPTAVAPASGAQGDRAGRPARPPPARGASVQHLERTEDQRAQTWSWGACFALKLERNLNLEVLSFPLKGDSHSAPF